jgi:serine/threonine-protein kinase
MKTPLVPVDREHFLANIRQSGLVDPTQLDAAAARFPDSRKGRTIARSLVEQGLLTRFQAERLMVGKTGGFIFGQYRVLDQLGRGGMGRVYKAQHQTMNRLVALKVLAPSLIKTERAQDLFLREVRAVARLQHANIVTAYDANQAGGRFFLVLEFVDGPNLDQLVRKGGPLAVGVACDFIRQVALGLQCAHEMGMVHRDIKPANLLVQRGDVIKISDFGLARLHDPAASDDAALGTILTKENTVMGTPDFLSPEQARCLHRVDIRSDLYSLGCTFYFLLTGQVPFPGGNTLEKLIRHSTESYEPIESLRPEVPPAVVVVVRRLLEKEAGDRHQTPAELAAALEPLVEQGPAAWRARTSPEVDLGETRPLSGSDVDFEVVSPDEASALEGTLPPDLGSTPIATADLPSTSRLASAVDARQRQRMIIAVAGAVAIVGGILALLALVSLLTQ